MDKVYLNNGSLNVELLGSDFAWFDTGTHESLFQASSLLKQSKNEKVLKLHV